MRPASIRRIVAAHLLVAAATATLFSSTTSADEVYYRWINDRGFPMLSDRPPPKGIDYEVVSTGSSFKRPVDAEEGAVPAEVEPSPGNEFAKEEVKKPAIEKNPEFCARAKENLNTLNTSARIRMRNDAGELAYIDEGERNEQKKQAQDNIKAYCE